MCTPQYKQINNKCKNINKTEEPGNLETCSQSHSQQVAKPRPKPIQPLSCCKIKGTSDFPLDKQPLQMKVLLNMTSHSKVVMISRPHEQGGTSYNRNRMPPVSGMLLCQ